MRTITGERLALGLVATSGAEIEGVTIQNDGVAYLEDGQEYEFTYGTDAYWHVPVRGHDCRLMLAGLRSPATSLPVDGRRLRLDPGSAYVLASGAEGWGLYLA